MADKQEAIKDFDKFCKDLHEKKVTVKLESKIYLKVLELFEKGVRAADIKGDY